MARLESAAKAGYFPTPPRLAAAITRHLAPSSTGGKRVVRLLDPCAGTGDAAVTIAEALGAESYGIELNEERAEAARVRLDRVLATNAFSVRIANGAFSLLYLNPPYDHDEEKRRLEHAFLTSLTRALCPDGILVFLLPQRRLAVSARYLSSHYSGFLAFRFPDPEFDAFGQMVLFAARRGQPVRDPLAQARLETWSRDELTPLPDEPIERPVPVPALPRDEILFASLFFDPLQAAAEARRRGVWVQDRLTEQLWPPDERPVRPLMPLRKGHLALLIAAGMLNNVVLDEGGSRVVVKGRTYKELVPVETDDPGTEVQREVIRTSVVLLDLTTGTIEVVDQEGSAAADPRERAA